MNADFQPTNAQGEVLEVLVALIGFSGVSKRPEQGEDIILDLLPGAHMPFGQPFCVRIDPEGRMTRISDEEAGLAERPSEMEALALRMKELASRKRSP